MPRIPDLPPPEFIPKDRWYTLLPKGTVGKIVALLIMLAAVIYFRSRASKVVGLFGNTIAPARVGVRTGSAPSTSPAHTDGAATNSVPSSAP